MKHLRKLRVVQQMSSVVGLFIFLVLFQLPAQAQEVRGPIYTARVRGPVTAVAIDYLRDVLRQAETADATALLITLSSSGGVLRDVRPFATSIARARVPVVVYVAPEGTQAGAPGTLLLSAAHVSAMAPDTSFGSAYPLTQVDATLSQQTRDLVLDSVVDQLRDWNAARGRNTDWLQRAVTEGAVLNNEQAAALEPPAIDLIAADQQQLLTLLEGRMVTLHDGETVALSTLGRPTMAITPSLWQSLRLALANPTIAFALLILGVVSVYLEFGAPGTSIFIGIGLVLLAASFLGFVVLPIRWWAMVLLLVGLVLMGLEFFVPAHGALAIMGLALLIGGALNLIDTRQAPGVSIAGWAVVLVALALAAFIVVGVLLVLRSRKAPVATGQEGLIGRLAEVRQRLDPEGLVFVEGALWQAITDDGAIEPGEWVRVTGMHNLRLMVRRIDVEETAS